MNELSRLKANISIISGIDYSKDRVQTSGSGAGNKQIEKMVDLEATIKQMICDTAELRNTAINQIQTLTNVQHVEILYKRYIECKSFETIASEMYLSYYRACHLHGDALQSFQQTVLAKDSK